LGTLNGQASGASSLGGASGIATIPFATWLEEDSVTILGQSKLLASSTIQASLASDNDDVVSQEWTDVRISDIVAGTGFKLTLGTMAGTFKGPVKVMWLWL
jgi:hypothetical protein